MELRVVELELKVGEQQQQLEDLSEVVYRQQKEIDALKAALNSLAQKLPTEHSTIDDKNERPPHY